MICCIYLRFSKTKLCQPLAFSAFNALRNKLCFESCFGIGKWNGSNLRPMTSSEVINGELPRISLELNLIFNFNCHQRCSIKLPYSKTQGPQNHLTEKNKNFDYRLKTLVYGPWSISHCPWTMSHRLCGMNELFPRSRLKTPAENGKHFAWQLNLIKRTKIIFNFSFCFSVDCFSVQFTDEMKTIITTNMFNERMDLNNEMLQKIYSIYFEVTLFYIGMIVFKTYRASKSRWHSIW